MKTIYAVLLLVAAYGLALNSFADEQRSPENQTQITRVKTHGGTNAELTIESNAQTVKIKAHGETVAEVKVADKGAVLIRGGIQSFEKGKQHLTPINGGLIDVQITCSGGLRVNIQAEDVWFGS